MAGLGHGEVVVHGGLQAVGIDAQGLGQLGDGLALGGRLLEELDLLVVVQVGAHPRLHGKLVDSLGVVGAKNLVGHLAGLVHDGHGHAEGARGLVHEALTVLIDHDEGDGAGDVGGLGADGGVRHGADGGRLHLATGPHGHLDGAAVARGVVGAGDGIHLRAELLEHLVVALDGAAGEDDGARAHLEVGAVLLEGVEACDLAFLHDELLALGAVADLAALLLDPGGQAVDDRGVDVATGDLQTLARVDRLGEVLVGELVIGGLAVVDEVDVLGVEALREVLENLAGAVGPHAVVTLVGTHAGSDHLVLDHGVDLLGRPGDADLVRPHGAENAVHAAADAGVLELLQHQDVLHAVLKGARRGHETRVAGAHDGDVDLDRLGDLVVARNGRRVAPGTLGSLVGLGLGDGCDGPACRDSSPRNACRLDELPPGNVLHTGHGESPFVSRMHSDGHRRSDVPVRDAVTTATGWDCGIARRRPEARKPAICPQLGWPKTDSPERSEPASWEDDER